MAKQKKVQMEPLTADRWQDLEALFGERGASDGCWCTFWRLRRSETARMRSAEKKEYLHSMALQNEVAGLLAYADGKAVGWCSIGPREDYAALERSRLLKRLDDKPVWSIVCFFMDKSARQQGLMHEMIRGAVAYAKSKGAKLVEAYPTDLQSAKLEGHRLSGDEGYMGIASVFRKAGFTEMKRASETKLIMRYKIR
jgi:GNAT superfamily N-acetyltransferase